MKHSITTTINTTNIIFALLYNKMFFVFHFICILDESASVFQDSIFSFSNV